MTVLTSQRRGRSGAAPRAPQVNLAVHEGRCLLSAAEAMLKGTFEAEGEVNLIAGPRGGGGEAFSALFDMAADDAVADLLRQHGTTLRATTDARRAIELALRAVRTRQCAFALVPNEDLDRLMSELAQAAGASAQANAARSGDWQPLCLVLEDHPSANPASCPRQAAIRLGLPCIEPRDLSQLRDAIESAMRLGRAGGSAVAIVVHHELLHSSQTVEARPNRVLRPIDVAINRPRRRHRWTEAGGLMRVARRLELNQTRSMPSPGERVAVGFITIGPADAALAHVTHTLHMHGRVPVLQLGLLNPLDESVVHRFLSRCEQVVVLEARPGQMESIVLAAAETMRRAGQSPATIWGRVIPHPGETSKRRNVETSKVDVAVLRESAGASNALSADEAAKPLGDVDVSTFRHFDVSSNLHPSPLARNIIHLLHLLRPAMRVASRLTPEPPPPLFDPPPRAEAIGEAAAMTVVRTVLADVDQRLRSVRTDEPQLPRTALAIDGVRPEVNVDRIVPVELWTAAAFREGGIAAISDAANQAPAPGQSGAAPSMFIVVELDASPHDVPAPAVDIERLVRAYVPPDLAERIVLSSANLNDRLSLRERLQHAATQPVPGAEAVHVIVVRDGPPPQYSPTAIEQSLLEIDRLGFEPRQWLIQPAEQVCALRRTPPLPEAQEAADVPQTRSDEQPAWLSQRQAQEHASRMKTTFANDKLSKRQSSRMRIRVVPLLEQIEVIRTRPPAWIWLSETRSRLELPTPIHARKHAWRAHLAGYRRSAPGIASRILCEAGTLMGYDVGSVSDAAPIGAGRRAWSQVLFTSAPGESRTGDQGVSSGRIVASIPYGEADVLLGLDWRETLRAVTPAETLRIADRDFTCTIVNAGAFDADADEPLGRTQRTQLVASLQAISRDEHCVVEDFASACRRWFYTDRVTDVALLGVAFQRGLVPVRLDAIETAVQRMESRGYGRLVEAFQFGRRLAVDERLLIRHRDEAEEDLQRVIRRMALSVRRTRWGSAHRAREFRRLVESSLEAMPGLSETSPGRQARRDMVAALYRCLEWGGLDYASRYAHLLLELYRADRGDKGRALTRNAVLPLAEAMLVRDPVYIACMAASPEQRRLFRRRLNVKPSRGDRVERRYLTRLELTAFGRRMRLDLRTSDWPARLARASRLLMLERWRGTKRDREFRRYVIDFIQRATVKCSRDYERWSEAMHRIHHHAAEHRLRAMALSELRMLAEPD